jgi:hypothetical protein
MPGPTQLPEPGVIRLTRAAFGLLAGAAGVIGGALLLFPGHTALYFAWTLKAPIAAVTLGGWFLGLAGFSWALARAPRHALRLATPTIALGSLLMLAATLIHRTAFNWGAPWAWIWLLLYVGAPPSFAVLSYRLNRVADTSKPVPRPSSRLRTACLTATIVAAGVGAVLFFWPTALIPFWPWPLVPLGARAYAAYALGYALWAWRVGHGQPDTSSPLWYLAVFPSIACLSPWLHFASFRAATPGGLLFLLLFGGTALLAAQAVWSVRRGRNGAA